MALTDKKISQADTDSNKVADLPLQPDMSGDELQERFDRLAMQIVIPRFNSLIDELASAFVASGITNSVLSPTNTPSATTVSGQLSYLLWKINQIVDSIATQSIGNGVIADAQLRQDGDNILPRTNAFITATNTALAGKATSSHTHDAANINSGTLALARIPTGTASTTVALGNHTHGYAATTHTHTADQITGTTQLAIDLVPTGTGATQVALGNHTHDASGIASGTLALARIPTGTTGTTVAKGDHTHSTYFPTANIIYSSSTPTVLNGAIWLKPI